MNSVVVVVLTYNSASVIAATLGAAQRVSRNLYVVDSYSKDDTVAIAEGLGATIVQRAFVNYAEQRNWAIDQVAAGCDWQLHLDADEVIDERAIVALNGALADPGGCDGFVLHRRTYFMGRALRFGGASNWHLRLFRTGTTRCEERLYDQHFKCAGRTRILPGLLHDMNVGSLEEWVSRHNRWSSLEAAELTRAPEARAGQLAARLSADPRERRRLYKGAYYKAPLLLRPFLLFCMRYFLQLGILDGRAGFLYAFLQVWWFRTLVDAKLIERRAAAAPGTPPAARNG
jgi:glycosyltransferase involved in cell wall biosynthesis